MDNIFLSLENERLEALERYNILDTLPEQEYDDITLLASQLCGTPIALISLLESDRYWFKSMVGVEADVAPQVVPFCRRAVQNPSEVLIVPDAASDARFAGESALAGDLKIKFYAGAPLVTPDGLTLGTLCVVDRVARSLTDAQIRALKALSRQVVMQFELRLKIVQLNDNVQLYKQIENALEESEQRFKAFMNNSPVVAYMKDADGRYVYGNETLEKHFNVDMHDLIGSTDFEWLPEAAAQRTRESERRVLESRTSVKAIETTADGDGKTEYWLSLRFPFTDLEKNPFVGGVSLNITELKEAEERLNESEKRFRHLFEHSQGFICVHDFQGSIASINPAAAQALGYSAERLIGKNFKNLLELTNPEDFQRYLERVSFFGSDEGFLTIRTRDGARRVWKYHNLLYQEEGNAPPYIIGYGHDVTDLQKSQEALRNLSQTDELTGLYNRRGFFTLAAQTIKAARRRKHGFLIIYADLDGLKTVNDTFGHPAGSQMIYETAQVFKKSLRDSDIIGRVGGDEFILLVDQATINEAETVQRRILSEIERFNDRTDQPFKIALSMGVADYRPEEETTLEEIIDRADRLMYINKRQRRQLSQATSQTADERTSSAVSLS